MQPKRPLQEKIAIRQEAEKQERRKCILDAARNVFSNKGYLNTTMRDIALEASLSPGLIYHYYGGKDELYGEICMEAFHILLEYCQRAESADDSALSRLLAMAKAYIRYYKDYPQYFDIISFRDLGFKKVSISAPILERIEMLSRQVLEEMHNLTLACIAEGSLRQTDDPWERTLCMWAAVEGLIFIDKRGYFETFELDLDRLLDSMLADLYLGLKP